MRDIARNLGSHDDYSPIALLRYNTRQQLEEEYRRMRKNLKRNVQRIEKSGEFDGAAVTKRVDDFGPPSGYDDRELALRLSDLEGVLSANTSTLTGLREQRAEAIETLNDRGFTEINKANYPDFVKFMDATRALTLSILRYRYNQYGKAEGEDRNKRLEVFSLAQKKGFTTNALIKDFKYFLEHMDEIKQLPDHKTGRKLGVKTIRKRLKEI